ncbi:hypothetical protein [Pseudonocardia acaciae]|uniref:hypothetical protein n=1 Tax=Pseudonocardia acaciae TaxID=551276 RepID=UPI00048F2E0A|nr:hypothetical protein [Pseudonocardia acaciae]
MPTTVSGALRTVGVASDTYGPTVNTALSPRAVDVLGEALADALRAVQPHALAIWDTSDEAVLAHAAAFRLGVCVLRASEVEGIITLDRDVDPDARLVPLATRWSGPRLSALRKVVTARGGRTVAVAAVLGSDALASVTDVPATALVDADSAAEFL